MVSPIDQILCHYGSENPGTRTNLARILNHGHLANTGKMIIYPVDQGMEHGPVRSFGPNPDAYDPFYHFDLAITSGVSAFAAPLGLLECGAGVFAGKVPLILKINSNNSLSQKNDQAITGDIKDALRLGCVGIGFTIYPGSEMSLAMMEQCRNQVAQAKEHGLLTIVWSYPRGHVSKAGETAVDVVSYGAHMAALLGAHIIKVKIPTSHVECPESEKLLSKGLMNKESPTDRIDHVVKSCFQGRRLVVFSGGGKKSNDAILQEVKDIIQGHGHGSIIGRNCFQRPRNEALHLIQDMINLYKNGL